MLTNLIIKFICSNKGETKSIEMEFLLHSTLHSHNIPTPISFFIKTIWKLFQGGFNRNIQLISMAGSISSKYICSINPTFSCKIIIC